MLSKLRRPKARWTEIVRIAADAVHLSPSSCLRRVRALEDAGIIKGYVALLDPAKIGKGFTAYARVWLTAQDLETVQCIVDAIQSIAEVVECHLMAGECDVMLRVVAADLTAYRKFLPSGPNRREGLIAFTAQQQSTCLVLFRTF